jgi:hypothetical protein
VATECVTSVIKIAQSAKHAEGRQSGLSGLETMLKRLSAEDNAHKDILKMVREIALSDRSKSVQEDAKSLLKCWRRRT